MDSSEKYIEVEEELFRSETVTTKQEYLKFNRYTLWVVNRQWISALVCGILLVAVSVLSGVPAFIWGIGLVIFAVLMVSMNEFIGRKTYDSNISAENERTQNLFYSDHIKEFREKGYDVFEYSKLYRICENKTHFYLMIAKNKGIIIPKSTCTPELIEFIRSVKYEYSK